MSSEPAPSAPRYRCSVCKKNLDDRVVVAARIDDEGLVVIYCDEDEPDD